jgi:uncharacterized protein (DUF488 family)
MLERTAMTVLTVGHSTHPIAEFIALLRAASVQCVIDVRAIARSRTNPQFDAQALHAALAAAGMSYLHLPALGGRRPRSASGLSPNLLWRNEAFRNYADYAASAAFRSGLDQLKTRAARERCAIMCAEAVWWRCHRRIIADYLLSEGIEVAHIMGAGRIDPAALTPGARRLPDGTLLYASA